MSMNYSEMGESFNPFIYDDVDSFTIDVRDFSDEFTIFDDDSYDDPEDNLSPVQNWATY